MNIHFASRLFGLLVLSLMLTFSSNTFAKEKSIKAIASSTSSIGTTLSPTRIVLPEWQFKPGQLNAITDVPGVKVGHVTISKDQPHKTRTGVTAILPHSDNLANVGLWASSTILNGNGEVTGLSPIETSGILNSPILLTNTFSVGNVHHGVFQFYEKHYKDQWIGQLPVVAECYDGYFNTINDLDAITPEDAVQAIESANSGLVPQGRIGAGTGMRSFELHAGIGTSSRIVTINDKSYTIGVLVNTNHSRLDKLSPSVKQKLEERLGPLENIRNKDNQDRAVSVSSIETPSRQGSIIVVIATNLPLLPSELKQLTNRASMGIGLMGSTMDTTSGDFAIAFSTATPVPLPYTTPFIQQQIVHPDALTPVYRATIEAVVEAQLQALLASHGH